MTKPMNIHEAIEAMKIIAPFVNDMTIASQKSGLACIRVLIDGLSNEDPNQLLRLIALMQHKDLSEVIDLYSKCHPIKLASDLADLFNVNSISDLMSSTIHLGLVSTEQANA